MNKVDDYQFADSLGVHRYERWLGDGAEECPKCKNVPEEVQTIGEKGLGLLCTNCGHQWMVEQKVKVTPVKKFDDPVMFGPNGEMRGIE